jgi:transposase
LKSTEDYPPIDVSNVLSEEKKKQVIALGQLGWSLRQIQKHTGVRRETAGRYLKAAGVGVRPPGSWGKKAAHQHRY